MSGYGAGALGLPSDGELSDLIDRREAARRARDYETSDRIREDLRARGVRLDDRTKSWEANDGRRGTFGMAIAKPEKSLFHCER